MIIKIIVYFIMDTTNLVGILHFVFSVLVSLYAFIISKN